MFELRKFSQKWALEGKYHFQCHFSSPLTSLTHSLNLKCHLSIFLHRCCLALVSLAFCFLSISLKLCLHCKHTAVISTGLYSHWNEWLQLYHGKSWRWLCNDARTPSLVTVLLFSILGSFVYHMKEDSVKFSVTAKGGTLILVSSQQSIYEWPQVFADKLHYYRLN